ncbi:MAG: NACHT domain-containing protein [Planctomycetota bacterium]|nr:NACHT domain-containing protein [Planctomycetota bacterium]
MPEKPPFIASQRLLLLDPNVPDPREFLSPEKFRAARLSGVGDEGRAGDDPDAKYWQPIDRRNLFCDPCIRRLCVTTDAGVGKSTMLKWAAHAIMAHDPRTLAIYIPLRDLPDSADKYLGTIDMDPKAQAIGPLVMAMLRDGHNARLDEPAHSANAKTSRQVDGLRATDSSRIAQLLRRLAAQRRLVLLVDALDEISRQAGDEEAVPKRVQALQDFLQTAGRGCRVVIAGRPFAIDRYWEALFARGDWRFAQIDHFAPQEQQQYLGWDRYSRVLATEIKIISVPRALEAIRLLRPQQLDDLRTASDVYWNCVDTMLSKAATAELIGQGFRDETLQWLLGALAFQMVVDGNFEGVTEGEFGSFCDRVWLRQAGEHPRLCSSPEKFQSLLEMLGKTIEFLDHGFLDGRGMKQVFWRKATAHWQAHRGRPK